MEWKYFVVLDKLDEKYSDDWNVNRFGNQRLFFVRYAAV